MRWVISPSGPLSGEIHVPGDKSVTHRAYILGAVSVGETVVSGFLRAEDTDNTLDAIRSLGVDVKSDGDVVLIRGRGPNGLSEPDNVLDLGNSGTGVRLLAGLLAGCPFLSVLTGDSSLRRRPMGRITDPLRKMGAVIDGRDGGRLLPLVIRGGSLKGVETVSPVSSAQVKTCVLLAGLQAGGTTIFREPVLSRDHTGRMLKSMGVDLFTEDLASGGSSTIMQGGQSLSPCEIAVPGDISSAAFFLVAGAIISGSDITIRNVGVNPTRTGIVRLLSAMGADVEIDDRPWEVEPVADIRVRGTARLKGFKVPIEWVPSIIDELPLVAVAAAAADGVTEIRGAGELRFKESDRITGTVRMLQQTGVKARELDDGFIVEGGGAIRGADFVSGGDHRIAMASAILALLAGEASRVSDIQCVATSFGSFPDVLNALSSGSLVSEPSAERGNFPALSGVD
ncbi:3-phosphoshikimate 1-carboxyvinyltransferase [bacterium BMS3Abin14]|nr:3-phosphoshikimate 1-carboxyvinyltransferase [bacterium BMS3Abin14]